MVTYDTLIDTAQEEVYSVVSEDSTVTAFNAKILDGLPYTQMQKKIGFPYIQIPCPEVSERQYTFDKAIVEVEFSITVYSISASVLREILDAIRKALRSGQATTMAANLKNKNIPTSNYQESILDEKTGKMLYQNTLTATYEFRGVDIA